MLILSRRDIQGHLLWVLNAMFASVPFYINLKYFTMIDRCRHTWGHSSSNKEQSWRLIDISPTYNNNQLMTRMIFTDYPCMFSLMWTSQSLRDHQHSPSIQARTSTVLAAQTERRVRVLDWHVFLDVPGLMFGECRWLSLCMCNHQLITRYPSFDQSHFC